MRKTLSKSSLNHRFYSYIKFWFVIYNKSFVPEFQFYAKTRTIVITGHFTQCQMKEKHSHIDKIINLGFGFLFGLWM